MRLLARLLHSHYYLKRSSGVCLSRKAVQGLDPYLHLLMPRTNFLNALYTSLSSEILQTAMRTSYSALQTYTQCPQKYKFQEIDRIPAKKSKEAVFGTYVHSALNFMFKQTPLFPTVEETCGHFRINFPASPNDVFETEAIRKAYFDEGVRILKSFYKKNPPWNFSVLGLETRFEVILEDEKNSATHILAGKIDRIDKLSDGTYEIIDYKTAKRLPSQEAVDSDLQLSLYALGVQKKWPHMSSENLKVSLYFLKHQEKLSSLRTPDSGQRVLRNALETISEISTRTAGNKQFEPMPSALCDYCPYKTLCPAWKHLYRKRATNPTDSAPLPIDDITKEYLALKKEDQKNGKRMDELQAKIKEYMEREGVTRVFGDEGYISRSVQTRHSYRFDKIREILEPIGKWKDILDADEKKLRSLMKELPEETRQKLILYGIETREFIALKVSLKKIKSPEEVSPAQ